MMLLPLTVSLLTVLAPGPRLRLEPNPAIHFGAQTSAARAPDCRQWQQCRQLTIDALAAGDYERAHDLAWRTVQLGPRNDGDLMYLLARAQSLSGRADDALVMLGRLLDAGLKPAAATDDAFRAVRALPGWPQLEARMTSSDTSAAPDRNASAKSPGTSSAKTGNSAAPLPPAEPSAASPAAGVITPAAPSRIEDALRLPGAGLAPSGLAYDGASARFVVADRAHEKLVIIDERSRHTVDLVRSSSAGFYDITGFEIDPRQGDLWVVSAERPQAGADTARATALHKLQLVSGRPLFMVRVPDDLLPARLDDVAVSHRGAVFVLDTIGGRLFRLQPSTRTLSVVATLAVNHPSSIAPADEHVVYVAHDGGIARVDVGTGMVTPVTAPAGLSLSGFERIRAEGNQLFGIQRTAEGERRAVSVRLVGGRAASLDVIASNIAMSEPSAATLSGDSFYYLTQSQDDGSGSELVVRRLRLP
jgi:hypothetical protein